MTKDSHAPDLRVIATEHFDVQQDCEVPIPGFFIISAIQSHRSITEFSTAEANEFIRLIQVVRRGMDEVLGIKDAYLFQNEDSEHGFHLWVFPRWPWMEPFGRKIQSVRPIMEYATSSLTSNADQAAVHRAIEQMADYLQHHLG